MLEQTLTPEALPTSIRSSLGEGPCWQADRLHWVDITGRQLHSSTLDGSEVRSVYLPQMAGFVVPHADGGWVAGFQDGLWHSDANLTEWRRLWAASYPLETHRLNDGKTDPQGRVWFGSMTYAELEPASALYRYDAAGVSEQMAGVTTSNGLGWSPDQRTFYYTDSLPRVIWAFDFDSATGDISSPRVFAHDPEGYLPDGGAVDDEGCFWSAKWNGGRIVRYAPDGRIDLVWHLPVANPTSCAFAGPDRSILAVTTAQAVDPGRAHELDGSVLLIPTTTTGPAPTLARF